MVGSIFTNAAESNYAPVEGECLAVADVLHKTKYYTQGCDKLVIGADHKSLHGLLNEKCLRGLIMRDSEDLKKKPLAGDSQLPTSQEKILVAQMHCQE